MKAPAQWRYLPLLLTQGLWASRRALRLPPAAGPTEGREGVAKGAVDPDPLQLLALGDSITAGVGVESTEDALPGAFSRVLAEALGQPVHWRAAGRNGRRSGGLVRSLERLPADWPAPQIVLVSIGVNDVTRPDAPAQVLEQLQAGIDAVHTRFPQALLLQLGLPPMGLFPALPQPLRAVLGQRAGAIDAAVSAWMEDRPRQLHLAFDEPIRPDEFAPDGYHPNARGVARWAGALVPAILPALQASLRHDNPVAGP